ncbi:MAG: ComEC/Rec2 family competence protein [Treponema sp.]|jgi:competence protein ComEC|nr:ComEC/Rec2 family competence protein [Treponema sp.]
MLNFRLKPILCAALAAAAGFYCFNFSVAALIAVLSVLLASLCFFRVLSSLNEQSRLLRLTAVCSAAIAVGFLLGICAASAGRNNVKFALAQEKITALEGVLLEDPRIISEGRAMATLSLRRCAGAGGLRVTAGGVITVFFPEESALKLREFGRGTTVFTEGRLRNTATGWIYGAESMHVVKTASPLERMRTGVRLNLIKRFDGKPWGGLALALLLGIKDNLDTNLAAMYRNAGCSYILALSGMHLAVLAALIAFLLRKPLGLKMSAIVGALIICLYCLIVGPMPSLNRAALMYLLGVLAVLGALPREPMSILALSFLIQIVVSPASGNSISFILSYTALAGILVIGQPLYSLFAGKAPDFLLQPLSASCGAFLATAGITGFSFGIIVPMGIITGLALVPLTTVFMIGSMIWLALDFIHISGFLNLPMSLLYQLMEKIVSLAGGIPGISSGKPFIILLLSLVLSLLVVIFEYKRRAALLRLEPFS